MCGSSTNEASVRIPILVLPRGLSLLLVLDCFHLPSITMNTSNCNLVMTALLVHKEELFRDLVIYTKLL